MQRRGVKARPSRRKNSDSHLNAEVLRFFAWVCLSDAAATNGIAGEQVCLKKKNFFFDVGRRDCSLQSGPTPSSFLNVYKRKRMRGREKERREKKK